MSVAFGPSWDLSKAETGFPMTSRVVTGIAGKKALAMSGRVLAYRTSRKAGVLQMVVGDGEVAAIDTDGAAHYEPLFRQGAIVVPRMLLWSRSRRGRWGLARAGQR